MEFDNEDVIRIRKLAHHFNEYTKKANDAVRKWMTAETALDKALILGNVRTTSAWAKQVIELVAKSPEYDVLHTEYKEGKMEERLAMNTLKAIETEMNALKKLYEEIPK